MLLIFLMLLDLTNARYWRTTRKLTGQGRAAQRFRDSAIPAGPTCTNPDPRSEPRKVAFGCKTSSGYTAVKECTSQDAWSVPKTCTPDEWCQEDRVKYWAGCVVICTARNGESPYLRCPTCLRDGKQVIKCLASDVDRDLQNTLLEPRKLRCLLRINSRSWGLVLEWSRK